MKKINRLEEVFTERGIYNRTIAQYLRVSESTVSRWVHNKQQPDLHKLYLIAEYLRVDIRDLLFPSDWTESKAMTFEKSNNS
ncbi:MAG: helix-turn-helix transcriptional regulator [Ignavibacteriaceae bacterium]|nr:helix-turn-helix transcriptional regulator [Ignavibacteriaceae bacterium]